MNTALTAATNMLDYESTEIQELIHAQGWRDLNAHGQIKAIYGFVQNKILFGYNRTDVLSAADVLADGYGQCNTKTTLLMALLRSVGIPCRLHGWEVSKEFQKGVTPLIVSLLAPRLIVHTWAEVLYENRWLPLEGVITDKRYFDAIKAKHTKDNGTFEKFAIAVTNLHTHSIDWDGDATYVQSTAIVNDLGVFASPDEFFSQHQQHWSAAKDLLYTNIGRKLMNARVKKLRSRQEA